MPKSSQAALARAVQCLLRPVLSFCLRHRVGLRDILEWTKLSLVQLAIEELKQSDETVSASKIALMTGVHRKDVTVFLKNPEPREMPSSVFMRVVGQWKSDKRYRDSEGRPRPVTHTGHDSEFAHLVRTVHTELNPYSVLFELQRVGLVEEKGDLLYLLGSEYVPYGKIEESFEMVSSHAHDLVRAAEENILAPQSTPNLHLATYFDNVTPEAIQEIRSWFMAEGAALHERARKFLGKFDKDINPTLAEKDGGARVVIGTFSLTEEPKEGAARKQENAKG